MFRLLSACSTCPCGICDVTFFLLMFCCFAVFSLLTLRRIDDVGNAQFALLIHFQAAMSKLCQLKLKTRAMRFLHCTFQPSTCAIGVGPVHLICPEGDLRSLWLPVRPVHAMPLNWQQTHLRKSYRLQNTWFRRRRIKMAKRNEKRLPHAVHALQNLVKCFVKALRNFPL